MKLAIVGSRSIPVNRGNILFLIEETLKIGRVECIVSGGATGADQLAEKVADSLALKKQVFKADWSLGRRAGPLRNTEIVNASDMCLAVVDKPLYLSKGTHDTVKKMKSQQKVVNIYYFKKGVIFLAKKCF